MRCGTQAPQHSAHVRLLLRRDARLPDPRVRAQGRNVQVPDGAAPGPIRGEHVRLP